MQGTYSYNADPRALPQQQQQQQQQQRARYREQQPMQQQQQQTASGASANIMWDRRVYRGSNFAPQTLPANAQPDPVRLQREAQMRRQRMAGTRRRDLQRSNTPPPFDGRQHMEIQTEAFLEEISDRPVEADADTQTDAFLDRPPSPLFVPQKSGVDATTQIEDGELFDFDREVDPILEVIVGKTLEQSMLEVLQEEELANMRNAQEHFQQLRNAELAETQRMEAAERRRVEEKERRKQQERERVERERSVREKVAARAFAQHFLAGLEQDVVADLYRDGYFFDEVQRQVESEFLPWLTHAVEGQMDKRALANRLLDHLLRSALERGVFKHREAQRSAARKAEQDHIAQVEALRRRAEEERLAAELKQAEGDAADGA